MTINVIGNMDEENNNSRCLKFKSETIMYTPYSRKRKLESKRRKLIKLLADCWNDGKTLRTKYICRYI